VLPESAADVPSLPIFHTRFVGRVEELTELLRLLADPACCLVTLVGPGGIGKTRLAVEVAQACHGFADGSRFVSLAPISTAALIVPAVANALFCRVHDRVQRACHRPTTPVEPTGG
jgi:predicted ATPase